MNFSLTEEQKMIVETVRSFVENEIYPHEEIVERTGEVPNDIAEEIKQKTIEEEREQALSYERDRVHFLRLAAATRKAAGKTQYRI